jgi:transposase
VNRMKATLVRFGVRNFKVKLREAITRLEKLRGPEDELLPPNSWPSCAAIWHGCV